MMRSKQYWIKRVSALEQELQRNATPYVKRIIRTYERAIDSINADIAKVFRGAAGAMEVSEAEAKEIITAAEKNELYSDLLKTYKSVTDEEIKAEIGKKINALAYGARIDRLDALKIKVFAELKKAQETEKKEHKALHAETLQKSYYTNIYNTAEGLNIGIDFSVLPKRAINKALSEKWSGANYSTRIWNNNDQFVAKVQQTIEDGIIGGHSVSRMADNLEGFVNTENHAQRYITERLARTETAHFMNEGQLQAYNEIGIEKYQYVAALAENTCDECGGLDGEEFYRDEAREGDNYPPMHANCRCTTIMAGVDPKTRIARDPETGKNYKVDGNMNFSQWKESLTDEQRSAMAKHVDKFGERKPLPTIGVDRYTFFRLTSDTAEGVVYDNPYALKGTVEISPTDSGGNDVFDADNGAYETSDYIEKLGHEITNADIPPEVDAMWRGIERRNGLVEVNNDVKTIYFGVAWRILKSDGSYRYVRYYKGSYSFHKVHI